MNVAQPFRAARRPFAGLPPSRVALRALACLAV